MWLYLDDRFAEHATGRHPESPERIRRVNARLRRDEGVASRCQLPSWNKAPVESLMRAHDRGYLHTLEEMVHRTVTGGLTQIEADTVVSDRSWDVARLASGAAIDAVDRVLRADTTGTQAAERRAAIVARPPGHHAVLNGAMGFCLINHAAVAARHAVEVHQLDRVLIVDFDVHHGNGTQDIFYEDPRVAFVSMHRWPFYPGTGAKDETGRGDGLGTIRNEPIEFGTPVPTILSRFRYALEAMVDHHRPQLVIISAGFDAHRDDPIGSLGLASEDFTALTETIIDTASGSAHGRIVSLMEGGYHLDRLPDCVELHLMSLLES